MSVETFSINFSVEHTDNYKKDDPHPVVALASAVALLLTTAVYSLRNAAEDSDTPIDCISRIEIGMEFNNPALAEELADMISAPDSETKREFADKGVFIGGEDDLLAG